MTKPMAVGELLPDVLQETLRLHLQDVKHVLESLWTVAEGVRDLRFGLGSS